jgi:predicted enzyme related to lactoylglutathione lyase
MIGPDFDGVPESWLSYLAVDNVDARLKAAKAAGAKVMREPFDVPGVGRIAIMQAPGGAAIAWITPVGDQ